MHTEAVTIQLRFRDVKSAYSWYTKLLKKPPDHVADETFKEWEVFENFWLQICEGTPIENGPRIRYGVQNLEETRKQLETNLEIEFSEILVIENVVALYNFDDPWGNKLGIFQDLQKYP